MKTTHDAAPTKPSGVSDRRREVRLGAPNDLRLTVGSETRRRIVRDISTGGLSIVSATPFTPGSVHTLCLTLGSLTVFHRARAIHCRRQRQRSWIIGFTFVGNPLTGGSTVESLLDSILSSKISFPSD